MQTIRQKIAAAREVHVFLDPDYAPDTPHAWTIKVSRRIAMEIVARAGRAGEPTGVIDKDGILVLHSTPVGAL